MAEHLGPIYFKRDDEVVVLLEKAYRDVAGDMEAGLSRWVPRHLRER